MKLQRILLAPALAALTLAAALAAAQGPAVASNNNPDLVEARNYTLTMDKIEKLAAAMDAVNKMLAADPALKAKVNAGSSNNLPIDQQARTMDANFPQITAVIHAHSLTTREFILISVAFINDVTYVGLKKQGMIQAYPPNSITPQNATFVEANWDKLQAIGKKITPPNQN